MAIAINAQPQLQNHALTVSLEPYNMPNFTRFGLKQRATKGVAVSAAAALAAVTISSFSEGIVANVTAYESQSAMKSEVYAIEIAEKFIESYAEMRSLRSLTDGWDGEGSIAPDTADLEAAEAFLASLPNGAPVPEAGVTADGYVEWYMKGPAGLATVSFNKGRLIYYARSPKGKTRGTIIFDGRSVPSDLLGALASI